MFMKKTLSSLVWLRLKSVKVRFYTEIFNLKYFRHIKQHNSWSCEVPLHISVDPCTWDVQKTSLTLNKWFSVSELVMKVLENVTALSILSSFTSLCCLSLYRSSITSPAFLFVCLLSPLFYSASYKVIIGCVTFRICARPSAGKLQTITDLCSSASLFI